MGKRFYPILLILITGLIVSCSAGGGSGVTPGITPVDTVASNGDDGRMPMGSYVLSLGEAGEFSVSDNRHAEMHANVTAFILPPNCMDCFQVSLTGLYGDIWEFDLHLKNPTSITGYDVRGVIYDSGPVGVINPDSYTEILAPVNDNTPLNPFFVFNSGVGANQWGPGATGGAHAIFKKPPGMGWLNVQFLVDASWPSNQQDPIRLKNLKAVPYEIYDDGSTSTTLSCKVDDWQSDVASVSADLSPIGGASDAPFTWADGKWVLPDVTHSPYAGHGPGVYDLLITATSGGKETSNYLRLEVAEGGISPEPAEWTFFVYLHASNLPDEEDINEMEMSGSVTGQLNIIVLWDKPEGEGDDVIVRVLNDPNPYDGSDLTLVSQVVNDYGAVIPPSKQLEMGDGETLRKFLTWGMQKYHAKHYLVDFWDHGGGIFQSGERPLFRNVCNGLNLWELRDAVQSALDSQTLVDKIDIIGFDVCILGEIETAYQLKDLCDYMIASEANEPGPGWDYGPPLISLKENISTQSAEEFTYNIVEAYRDSYDETPAVYHYSDTTTQAGSSTQVLVDTLIPELNALADELIAVVADQKAVIQSCRDSALNFYDPEFPDLGHFTWLLTQEDSLPQSLRDQAVVVLNALDSAMVLHAHTGTEYFNEFGYRIWFPENIAEAYFEFEYVDPGYLNFHETRWDEFLYAYGDPQHPVELVVDEVLVDDISGGDGDGLLEAGETADISVALKNKGYFDSSSLMTWLQEDDSYVEVTGDYSVCDLIPAGEIRWVTNAYTVSVDALCPAEHTYNFTVYINDEDSKVYQPSFKLHSSQIHFAVIDYDPNYNSGPKIGQALDDLGYGYDYILSPVAFPDVTDYDVLFICLGVWTDLPSYILTQAEGEAIVDFLNSGGSVYLEGGDCWYFDVTSGGFDIASPFGIEGIDDGWFGDLSIINSSPGAPFSGFSFSYVGDNGYPDHIIPLGGSGAKAALTNFYPEFDCMVGYDAGTYRTIGASFEFGGLEEGASPNTQAELMEAMLSFLGG